MEEYKLSKRQQYHLNRLEKNITLTEIASVINKSVSLLSKYERGQDIALDTVRAYQDYIDQINGVTRKKEVKNTKERIEKKLDDLASIVKNISKQTENISRKLDQINE
ncbi:helix-turn-helix domain-containing protein [Enterococcus casseliflavus]|uniref:helix-turn-helix domain-containing protein n=1 Tax=Enterococcus casseliflavus TaxID=37734 RepID=UPI0039A5B129